MGLLNRALLAAAALQLAATGGALAQNVSGAYVGHVQATHWPATAVSLNVRQGGGPFPTANQVTMGYATLRGVRGTCSGYLFGNVAYLNCNNSVVVNGCSGHYYGPFTFSAGGVSWTFGGEDCRGFEAGNGAAFRITQRARRHRRAK